MTATCSYQVPCDCIAHVCQTAPSSKDRALLKQPTSSFLQLNLEYHIQMGGPFRVVLFGDAGGVFGDDQTLSTDLLRYSAGAEVRVRVPIFPAPLRFIYAFNLEELPDDRFNSFDFSLSTSF